MAKKSYRKKLLNICIILVFLFGVGITTYPFFSNWYNQKVQNGLIEQNEASVAEISKEEKQTELQACSGYNKGLIGNAIIRDPFDPEQEAIEAEAYNARLNMNYNGIMGYIEIPQIHVKLNIYHGTTTDVLDKGVGHLENTSLPIGGMASHAVLSAHTAYAKATLFNDLIKLVEGDVFYLNILGDKLAYQVDQIKVVEPIETGDLKIDKNEDYVTLITCTPYGVNSHRLLVRGTRIPYDETAREEAVLKWNPDFMIVILGIAVLGRILFIVSKKQRRKK